VLLCVLCVKSFSGLKEGKGLTQRAQRSTEEHRENQRHSNEVFHPGWNYSIESLPLQLVLQRLAWYMGKAKNCEV
jgi:hypothetical protein